MATTRKPSPDEPAGSLFDLSTEVATPIIFTVDEAPYQLKQIVHLSKRDEARARWLFTREHLLMERINALDPNKDEATGMTLSEELRKVRVDMILLMTTCPREVVEKIPFIGQLTILAHIGGRLGAKPDEAKPDEEGQEG